MIMSNHSFISIFIFFLCALLILLLIAIPFPSTYPYFFSRDIQHLRFFKAHHLHLQEAYDDGRGSSSKIESGDYEDEHRVRRYNKSGACYSSTITTATGEGVGNSRSNLTSNERAARIRSSSSRKRRRILGGPGSSPPRCATKCGKCTPCKPVHVAVPPGNPVIAEYYPEAWRCKCGNKLYMP